uniref:Uncharacterized protein n=1 Tax=Meloidogyne enterolobii TaxID=390850 RepID=A0A6V7VZT2_MELEN|nr:unnamed protein product [Meloidogyne enterolobii]
MIYIEFGRKKDIFTIVYLDEDYTTESFLGNDAELRNEYISNIEKGAYLHKYAGLWALGLDLLPTSAHRSLDLFVYKGCVCSTGALVML